MVYLVFALIAISFFASLTLVAIIISQIMTLDRYKSYCTIWYYRDSYEKEYDKLYSRHKKTIYSYFLSLAVLVANLIVGYSFL